MSRTLTAALLPALLLAAGAAEAQTAAATPGEGPRFGERAEIPLINHRGIRDFKVDGYGEGLYIQDRAKNWYYARFFSRCSELTQAFSIGFQTFGDDTLERGGAIVAGRQQCRIADLVHSGAPPKKAKKAKA